MWTFKQKNILWRIPARSYGDAVALLCRILFVKELPPDVRFLSGPEW